MREFPFYIFIDSCAFHPPQASEKTAVSELFKLKEEGKISDLISYKVDQELSKAPSRIARQRIGKIYTMPVSLTIDERKTQLEIRNLLFGDKQKLKSNERNDVDNIFEAQKYGYMYFVTLDKNHILSKTAQIEKRFKMKVVTPSECLREIKEWLARYDQNTK